MPSSYPKSRIFTSFFNEIHCPVLLSSTLTVRLSTRRRISLRRSIMSLPGVGRGPVTVAAVRTMVGQGLRRLIERSLIATGGIPDESDVESMFSGAFEFYGEHLTDQSFPFPGAIDVLDHLATAGVKLGVCTNKPIAPLGRDCCQSSI